MLRQSGMYLGGACRFQRDDAKFRGRTKGYFEGTRQTYLPDGLPAVSFSRGAQNHGVICLRRLDVQEQVCERADDDDDRFAGAASAEK